MGNSDTRFTMDQVGVYWQGKLREVPYTHSYNTQREGWPTTYSSIWGPSRRLGILQRWFTITIGIPVNKRKKCRIRMNNCMGKFHSFTDSLQMNADPGLQQTCCRRSGSTIILFLGSAVRWIT